MHYLPWSGKKRVVVELVRAVLQHRAVLDEPELVERLFTLAEPLVRDPPAGVQDDSDEHDGEEGAAAAAEVGPPGSRVSPQFEAQQTTMAKLVHLMRHDDTDTLFRIYVTSRRYFGVLFYLEDLIGRPVDLVTDKALRSELRPSVEREAVRV